MMGKIGVRWNVRKVMLFDKAPLSRGEVKSKHAHEEKLSSRRSPDVASIVMRLTRCQRLSFVSCHVVIVVVAFLAYFHLFFSQDIIVIVVVVVNSGSPRAF